MIVEINQINVSQWFNYFSGQLSALPNGNLEKVSTQALSSVKIINGLNASSKFSSFCENAIRPDFVCRIARLRRHGRFPAIISEEDGVVLASRLVHNWNVLMIQDAEQRLFVFQGVTSCDAVYLPGLNTLIIFCHITYEQIKLCLQVLSRSPEFFRIVSPGRFLGYLVGHSRPYHSNYDSLLALQSIFEEGEIQAEDALFSKCDEAFMDFGSALGLAQDHQFLTKTQLNNITEERQGYLLKLGFLFYRHGQGRDISSLDLASHVDRSLRQFANTSSALATSGALDFMEECQPLLWVGITGQKRCWLEQVEGTANILNSLYEYYPKMGVIFDGWTPPLFMSDHDRNEARNDDKVIRKIIKLLRFRKHGRFGIIAGLPMVEKIRVGMSVDLFLANFTTGSINVARVCQKPGVGHMSRSMMSARDQHIHYYTREIDPILVHDLGDPGTPTGYINYSVPWQAINNSLLDILAELPIEPSRPLVRLSIPNRP